jgi:hypothetical protein
MDEIGIHGNFYGCDIRASGLGDDYIAKRIAKGGPLCDGMELGRTPSNCNDLIGYTGEIVAAQARRYKREQCGLEALARPPKPEQKARKHRVVGQMKILG